MAPSELRERIKEVAVDHFNTNGYHGSTIRQIANEVNCSLPMIYYYFKNKKELFDEIIKIDYFDLLSRQSSQLQSEKIIDLYTEFVFKLNRLSDYERKVYRLGIKVYLSFDGDEELKEIMDVWEQNITERHHQIIAPHLSHTQDPQIIVRTLIHLLEHLIESIVVKNRFLSEEEIREEISVILHDRN